MVSPKRPPKPKLWGHVIRVGTPAINIDDKAINIGKNTTRLKKALAFKWNIRRIDQINIKPDKAQDPRPIVTITGATMPEENTWKFPKSVSSKTKLAIEGPKT